MLDSYKDVSFIIPFPKNLTPPKEYNHPRVLLLEAPEVYEDDYYQYFRSIALEPWFIKQFNQLVGNYYYDVIWNDQPRLGNVIKMSLGKFRDKTAKDTPIYNLYEFSTVMGSPIYVTNVAIGSVGTIPLFDSKVQERKLFRKFREVLSPSQVLELRESTLPFYMGSIDIDGIEEVKKTAKREDDTFTIHYANRLASHYEARDIVKLLDYFYSRGNKIKVVLTIPQPNTGRYGSDVIRYLESHGIPHEIFMGLGQKDFWKVACSADCFVFTIKKLEFMASALEQIMCGQIGIFENTEYMDDILPNYPYKIDGLPAKYAFIEELMKNKQKYQNELKPFRSFIEENYKNENFATKLYEDMKVKVFSPEYKIPRSIAQVMGDFDIDSFTYDELKDYVKKNSETKVNID
jgi:hypothetical protein